jgi:hypothetical protein
MSLKLNDRTNRLWLPGLTILLGAIICLCLIHFYFLTFGQRIFWLASRWPVEVNFPWLCVLPFLGAGAACWSRRQGGSRVVRAAAGLFPVLLFIAIFWFEQTQYVFFRDPLPICIAGKHSVHFFPVFAWAVLNWVIIPAVVLLFGVLPFLREGSVARRIS